jgi:hypothetical protein
MIIYRIYSTLHPEAGLTWLKKAAPHRLLGSNMSHQAQDPDLKGDSKIQIASNSI